MMEIQFPENAPDQPQLITADDGIMWYLIGVPASYLSLSAN